MEFPKTLMQAVTYFSDPQVSHEFMVDMRWPGGVRCPHCGHGEQYWIATRRVWRCKSKACGKQFSVKVGTIFEDSPLGLDKWLVAVWLVMNAKNGISSYEIGRALGVTQKTAWHMSHRIREAMDAGSLEPLPGPVEVDETFVGGQMQKMHATRRLKVGRGRFDGKTIVFGLKQRDGEIRTHVVENIQRETLFPIIRDEVEPGAPIYTDQYPTYAALAPEYVHETVNHNADEYVRGDVHTQQLDNFWGLFKRSVRGTWICPSRTHMHRYLADQEARYNNRTDKDGGRFTGVVKRTAGKRLTYRVLTATRAGRGPAKGFDWRNRAPATE